MAEEDEPTKDKGLNKLDIEEETPEHANLDLVYSTNKPTDPSQEPGPSESVPRRDHPAENNPFSFRHFLNNNGKNYQNQGARPKIYCEAKPIVRARPTNNDVVINQEPSSPVVVGANKHSTNSNRIVNEYPSALPDFVQDHLVIEQCYLGNAMPDCTSNNPTIPLDLPIRPPVEFPLDLPIGDQHNSSSRTSSEVGNSKSLPDFLSDGAVVRNQSNEISQANSPEREVDRLRQEADILRRQLGEQTRRADYLRDELEVARKKEHEYTQNLAEALEQVEENLEWSKVKSTPSDDRVSMLNQEVRALNREISRLREENAKLASKNAQVGVASGGPSSNKNRTNDDFSKRHRFLAEDLRSAASTAEQSLMQLLSGVENLRFLASKVDTMARGDDSNTFNSDLDSDEDAGPAL